MTTSDWLAEARRASHAPPLRPRVPLYLERDGGPCRVGSVEPAMGRRLLEAGDWLCLHDDGFAVRGPTDASLSGVAGWLRKNGLAGAWRNELLSVVDDEGRCLGSIERAAVRPLGLTTFAVHLIGRDAADRCTWVQQRAFDKSTDPGLWDTLMGGQVSAGESATSTLERETMEEAGLAIEVLLDLTRCAPMTMRRPVAEGYMVEHLDVFRARVPAGTVPVNQDGEVERFECIDDATLVERMAAGEFTLEASLILAADLERRLTDAGGSPDG